jgi:hypothetical protein
MVVEVGGTAAAAMAACTESACHGQAAVFAGKLDASVIKAISSFLGKVLRRLSERRRMPAAALADTQNLGGTGARSSTADKVDSTTTLGRSEPARVQNPVGPPIPEVGQTPENDTEVASSVGVEQSWNILNDDPSWPQFGHNPSEFKPETAALAG